MKVKNSFGHECGICTPHYAKARADFVGQVIGCSHGPDPARIQIPASMLGGSHFAYGKLPSPSPREDRIAIVIEELEILPDEDGMYRFAAPIPAGTKFRLRYPEDRVSASTAR